MVYIELTRNAYKKLATLPAYIRAKLKTWIAEVELCGLAEVRKRSGFHDEPLKGRRDGQRAIRLNKAYRAIYEEYKHEETIKIIIMEISKHAY